MKALARAVSIGVGVLAFLVAEALGSEQSRSLVAALFPSDDEWVEFLNDPVNAFPGVEADGEAPE